MESCPDLKHTRQLGAMCGMNLFQSNALDLVSQVPAEVLCIPRGPTSSPRRRGDNRGSFTANVTSVPQPSKAHSCQPRLADLVLHGLAPTSGATNT